jgi:NAD(P)-dependent dehydrogenase (short-subunit alcohol dehydrogenase family)
MARPLEGKAAFITGAASGIGEATARRFAQEGARIVLADVADDLGARVCDEINDTGAEAIYVHCDVTDPDSVRQAFETAVARFGQLHIVFANAGIAGVWAPLEDMHPAEWEKTLRTNLEGAFLTLHFAIPHLKESGGSIIVTSSVSGNRTFGQPGAAAYSTSKAGLVALTKMAALELARYGIRVNAVCPGGVPTRITDALEERNTDRIPSKSRCPRAAPPCTTASVSRKTSPMSVYFSPRTCRATFPVVEIYVDGGRIAADLIFPGRKTALSQQKGAAPALTVCDHFRKHPEQPADADKRLDRFYEAHADRVFRLCLRLTGNCHSEAEDLAQEVLVAALQSLPRFAGRAQITTWLYTIAVRTYRKRESRREPPALSLSEHDPADTSSRLSAGNKEHLLHLSITAALADLPVPLRRRSCWSKPRASRIKRPPGFSNCLRDLYRHVSTRLPVACVLCSPRKNNHDLPLC